METLLRIVDQLIAQHGEIWKRRGNYVQVKVDRHRRTQRVHLAKHHSLYQLTSVVAMVHAVVGDNPAERRQLQRRIWTRNALKPLVNFRIDGRDRIVGSISIPVGQESLAVLEFYLKNLARDCDRFEYILTGQDRH